MKVQKDDAEIDCRMQKTLPLFGMDRWITGGSTADTREQREKVRDATGTAHTSTHTHTGVGGYAHETPNRPPPPAIPIPPYPQRQNFGFCPPISQIKGQGLADVGRNDYLCTVKTTRARRSYGTQLVPRNVRSCSKIG